ncbi:hypothetical protein [Bacillus sp. 179-C3.3 HS]|uniref:hypothetical protein n=1 Tax=Bacillus sp. 179-C3.3 HS TaxID=3232162 RepID=UPI0039A08B22
MEFTKKKPTDADRFLQRLTDTHTTTSIFSNANFDTENMTPAELAALKAKIKEEQKTALAQAIRQYLQNEFAEDRQHAQAIIEQLDTLQSKVRQYKEQISSNMKGKAIDSITEKIDQRLKFNEVKEDVQAVIDSIGL